jgi:hypothetical protein
VPQKPGAALPFLVLLLEDNINSGATYPAICCAQHIAGFTANPAPEAVAGRGLHRID